MSVITLTSPNSLNFVLLVVDWWCLSSCWNWHNCGPFACSKVMEVLGYVEKGSVERIGSVPSGYHCDIMTKFSELLAKYNDMLMEM
jgi:hypothetical protein